MVGRLSKTSFGRFYYFMGTFLIGSIFGPLNFFVVAELLWWGGGGGITDLRNMIYIELSALNTLG